jgi:uncharacterized GH25 family protein
MRSPQAPLSARRKARSLATLATTAALLAVASSAGAHDFWLIPDMFAFSSGATVHVNGRSGTRFPAGTAVQPTRVAEARIIGATSDVKITDMAVEGTALRLRQKPEAAGQYVVAAALTPPLRMSRAAPSGLLRFLRAEGGAGEAARLMQLHVGDTLHLKIVGNGQPVAHIAIDATPAVDTTADATVVGTSQMVTITADANGVAHLPLTKAGSWIVRSAYVSRRAGGAANEFDVARSTYTLSVGARR